MGTKGAKRSVKMWTTNFCKSFFMNILLYMNGRLSKIRSVHTYLMTRTVYFDWIYTWTVGCQKFVQYIRMLYNIHRTVYFDWICMNANITYKESSCSASTVAFLSCSISERRALWLLSTVGTVILGWRLSFFSCRLGSGSVSEFFVHPCSIEKIRKAILKVWLLLTSYN